MGKKPAGGFNVVMIAGDTGFMEPMELFCAEKSHGSAQINPAFPMHGFKGMNGLVEFAAGQCPSGSHNGKTVHTFGFMHFAGFENVLFRQKIIDLAVGMMVGGLGAVFTILRASPASSVDDGTQIYLVADESFPDLICALTQLVQIAV